MNPQTVPPSPPSELGTWFFRIGVALQVLLGLGAMLFAWAMLAGAVGSQCSVDGIDCAALSMLQRLQFIAGAAAPCFFIALLALRLRRRSPRAALWLVTLLPIAVLALSMLLAIVQAAG